MWILHGSSCLFADPVTQNILPEQIPVSPPTLPSLHPTLTPRGFTTTQRSELAPVHPLSAGVGHNSWIAWAQNWHALLGDAVNMLYGLFMESSTGQLWHTWGLGSQLSTYSILVSIHSSNFGIIVIKKILCITSTDIRKDVQWQHIYSQNSCSYYA